MHSVRSLRTAAALALGLALVAGPVAAPVSAQEAMIGEFKLPAGALVVTAEDHATKRAVVDTWVGVGSATDFQGYRGLATATARTLWGGLLPALKALGGDGVVAVDRETTHFQLRVPTDKLEDAIALAGQTLAAPDWDALAPDTSARPKLDDPLLAAQEAFMREGGDAAYGHPPAGDPTSLKRIGKAEVRAFFERYYLPSRLRVVLVGDIATGKAVGMVVRNYAAVLKRVAPGQVPPEAGASEGTWTWKLGQPLVVAGVKGPDVKSPREQAAMEVVGEVLRTRLTAALGEPDIARLVGVRFERLAAPSPLVLAVAVARPDALATVEKGLRAAFDDLRQNQAGLAEHARAVAAVAQAATPDAKNLAARATALGFAATVVGDPLWVRTYPEIVRQVSRQDMQDVVQKYATPDAVKTMVLSP